MLAFLLGRLGGWWITGTPLEETFTVWWDQLGEVRLTMFLAIAAGTIVWFWGVVGHYTRRRPFWDELRETLQVLLVAALVDAALVFFGKWQFSRVWLVTTWSFALVLVPSARVLIKKMLILYGWWLKPSVIIGVGENAVETFQALRSEPLMGYRVIAFLALPDVDVQKEPDIALRNCRVPIVSLGNDPEAVLEGFDHPQVVVALESHEFRAQQDLIQRLGFFYADMNIVPSLRGLPLFGMETSLFFSHELLLLRARNNLERRSSRLAKRCFDIAGSAVLLVLFAPLFALISLRIWMEGGAPIIFVQRRVGLNGKTFDLFKFRSMVNDADRILSEWRVENQNLWDEYQNHNFKLHNDPRLTKVGKWLRQTSIDELPQLWNVLKGDMSLVGPRPLLERELPCYGDSIRLYRAIRPGVTGLWQISGRSETTFSDRVALDAWYVRNWSLWHDIIILLKTIKVVLKHEGAY